MRISFNLIGRGSNIGGTLTGLTALFLIVMYAIIATNMIKVAYSKKYKLETGEKCLKIFFGDDVSDSKKCDSSNYKEK